MPPISNTKKGAYSPIRVFISSTFSDMQAERDHLVRFVFPKLYEELLPFRIHLVDVDLRWGVTGSQDPLLVCRQIIDECQYFVSLLGGRYGEVKKGQQRSVTADEIFYGALDRPSRHADALFYFRDPVATASIVETYEGEYREVEGSANESRLQALKQSIIEAGYQPVTYWAQWQTETKRLTGLQEFGQQLYTDLKHLILNGQKNQPEFLPNEFEEENAAMDIFVDEHTRWFVQGSRETTLAELLRHLNEPSSNEYICVSGPPGSGKSTILARVVQQLSVDPLDDQLVMTHFVGASTRSTDIRRMLQRFCVELKQGAGIEADIPDNPKQLIQTFSSLLAQSATQKRIVIIIDAINRFDISPELAEFSWLPEEVSNNVRFILSALPGPGLAALATRRSPPKVIEVPPLSPADGKSILATYLKRYGKLMTPQQQELLLSKPGSNTPLYLLAALEELRTLGNYKDITDRISDLPDETQSLFKWILKRLEQEDGFRDAAGKQISFDLVKHFAELMGASRQGLSYREMMALLVPATFSTTDSDTEGNLAALLRLLRPYLMQRGELIDMYHEQFREAIKHAYLSAQLDAQTAHTQLASYFRQKTNTQPNYFEAQSRPLAELPYHLAHGGKDTDLCTLFSQLPYLAARVETGQIYELITNFSLLSPPLSAAPKAWQEFLKKHAHSLVQHPLMLVALANHEGFPEAQAQARSNQWPYHWLRTDPEPMPVPEEGLLAGVGIQVNGRLEFRHQTIVAVATQLLMGFFVERFGIVGIFDAHNLQTIPSTLSVRSETILTLACDDNAESFVVFYETAIAELYRCIFGPTGYPVRAELVLEFPFYLPEYEPPVVAWHEDSYWFQADENTLGSVSIAKPQIKRSPMPNGVTGELSALIFTEGLRLGVCRLRRDTVVFSEAGSTLYISSADVSAACACGHQRVAVAFTNGDLIIFEGRDPIKRSCTLSVGVLRGALGWDGTYLLWSADTCRFCIWQPGHQTYIRVHDNEGVFPTLLDIRPRYWQRYVDEQIMLTTDHGVFHLRLLPDGQGAEGRFEHFFGGPVWRAVRKREREQWLLESQPLREVLLGRDIMGRTYCAPDGQGRFYVLTAYGPAWALDLSTLHSFTLDNCPPALNVAVGEDSGGSWFVDRRGDIYFTEVDAPCTCLAKIDFPNVAGAQITNCGEHLIWHGYSNKSFPGTGADPARTFVFFRKHHQRRLQLERLGEQFRPPMEGICSNIWYKTEPQQIVMLWFHALDGYSILTGTVLDFLKWDVRRIPIKQMKSNGYGYISASLSADGEFIGMVQTSGRFQCLRLSDGEAMAILEGSSPFTSVAPGKDGTQFWLLESNSKVFNCTLIEPL